MPVGLPAAHIIIGPKKRYFVHLSVISSTLYRSYQHSLITILKLRSKKQYNNRVIDRIKGTRKMSTEGSGKSSPDLFEGFGQPREPPQNTAPWNPEMAKSMAATIAHIEAQRLEKEAEMNTSEGRKKAAKAAEAELLRKRHAWEARAWALPLDGFIGIQDSAKNKELQIYTRTYDKKHKFWGVKPVGMTIWDFWNIHDPEVKRYHDANQETPASPEPSTVAPPPTNAPQRTKSPPKSRRGQRSSNINSTHRVTKSTTPKVNNSNRKSLAHKIDVGDSGLEDQVRDVKGAVRTRSRPTRDKAAVTVSGVQHKPAKAKPTVQGNTSSQPKRPRGRPPTKDKSTRKSSNQKKTPAVKGNARVTKSSQKDSRPSAPSTHKMRTRRAGPAESLQLP